MSDETNSAESNPELPPTPTSPPPVIGARRNHSHWYWVKRLLACNPFYLVSAALLLFGMYRVSIDPTFLRTETSQLVFNFTSLQFYELLLVFTAIVLARRYIWYDATLLVVLENLLVLVPFILVSQAALIKPRTVWVLCAAAALMALGRSAAARRQIYAQMFSPGLLAGGLAVLAANAVLPILYGTFHETKFGTKLPEGAAFRMNELSWLWVLPALCALANLLPRPRENGEPLVQRPWFPVGLLLSWLVGTGVHLYSLGYVYDFDLRHELLAPTLWVLAWTLCLRLKDFAPAFAAYVQPALLMLPVAVTVASLSTRASNIFCSLSILNFLALTCVTWRERGNRLALHLALVSFGASVAAVPPQLVQPMVEYFDRAKFIAGAALGYLMIGSALSRNPKMAILGAIAAALTGGILREPRDDTMHWAAQAGLVFFLLHSLRWRDYEHQGAAAARAFVVVAWVVHSLIWVSDRAAFWHPVAAAGMVLVAWWFKGFVFRVWRPRLVPIAAALVMLASPANLACVKLETAPVGVIAIVASFLLFAAGTAAALTKHRWHRNGQH